MSYSLDPDQDRPIVMPDLDPRCLTLDDIPERYLFLKKL